MMMMMMMMMMSNLYHQCSTTGVTKSVVYNILWGGGVKDVLLLIERSSS